MRRHFELALEFDPRQTERFELANAFGIAAFRNLACFLLFVFPFFQSLGEAGFRVDESFSSVTHKPDYTDRLPGIHPQPSHWSAT